MGIALHILVADGAVQQVFVVFFQTNFADVVGAAVVNRVDGILLALTNPAYVTQHMGK